jgi:hypothetical protein
LGDTIVDLSYALEDEAGASIRSPWIERQTGQPLLRSCSRDRWWWRIRRLRCWRCSLCASSAKAGKIERMVATVFEPASENGQKGMDELHEQTVNLLSFQELPKNVFDIQVAFNMVARYGQRSQLALRSGVRSNPEALPADCPRLQPSPRCRCCKRRSFTGTASRFTWRWRSRSRSRICRRRWRESTWW